MNMHDNILDNFDQYTAKQLVRYIRQGIITLDELCEEGLAVNIRHEIENLLEVNQEDDDWQERYFLTEAHGLIYTTATEDGKYPFAWKYGIKK